MHPWTPQNPFPEQTSPKLYLSLIRHLGGSAKKTLMEGGCFLLENHLGRTRSKCDTSHFLHIRVLSDSTSLFTVPTCRTFEGDTMKFLGKASAGKLLKRCLMFMFKVVML